MLSDADKWLRSFMEGVVVLLVVAAPWCFGAVDPTFEYLVYLGIGLVAGTWAVRSLMDRMFLWMTCPVALCVGAIFLVGALQLIRVPQAGLYLVSPAAAKWNSELRPEQPEVLSAGEPSASQPGWPAVSYSPAATKQALARILALMLLYGAVRTNLTSIGSYQRLAWVAVANGVALTIFGLWQFANDRGSTGPHSVVLGHRVYGDAFGPFICRNHFAFYINLCIGFAASLLYAAGRSDNDKRARSIHKAQALVEQSEADDSALSMFGILHSPQQLWLVVCVAVMVTGVVASMSRGGVAALAGATIVAYVMRGPVKRAGRLDLLAIPIVLGIGLVTWIGIKPLESRLNLFRSGTTQDGRLEMWKNTLPIALSHPVLGTGYGTTQYIEPLYRSRNYGAGVDYEIDHVHNDYLQAFIEGGVSRLVATLLIVWFLYRFARKAMERHDTRTPGRYAFGSIIGIGAVCMHSFVDFGMSTPAVAVLATVAAAHLCSLARVDPTEPPNAGSKRIARIEAGGWGGLVGAVGLAAVIMVMVGQGSRMAAVDACRVRAFQSLKNRQSDLAISALSQAVRIAPDDPELRIELGQIYLDTWNAMKSRLTTRARSGEALAMLAGENSFGVAAVLAAPKVFELNAEKGFHDLVKPALRQFIAGRDLCPLLARPHARLAAWAFDAGGNEPRMAKSDPAQKYWQRTLKVAPYDPDLLYQAGRNAFEAGRFDEAWGFWRKSLERRPAHLSAIVNSAIARLGAEGVVDRLIVDDPAMLLQTAELLANRPDHASTHRRVLERAKSILQERVLVIDGPTSFMLAQCYAQLNESDPAITAFEQAIALQPMRYEWRYEYARFLYNLPGDANRSKALVQLREGLKYNASHQPTLRLRAVIEAENR